MSGESKMVCITGCSGYIASWLVKLLLRRGYTVRAAVPDLNDPKKTEHLRALDGVKERLTLFKVNLLDEGDLIVPAVKGTLNDLESSAKAASIRKVIITCSMAAWQQFSSMGKL